MRKVFNKSKSQAGFTLIEILVVVAIVGVISSVVLTMLSQTRVRGRDVKRKQDLIQLQKAVEMFYQNNGRYPCSGTYVPGTGACNAPAWRAVSTNNSCGTGITNTGATGYIPDLSPTFILTLPNDPRGIGTSCAGYAYRSDGVGYKILSNTLAGVGPETFPTLGQPFYNAQAPTTSMMVCATANPTACAWN